VLLPLVERLLLRSGLAGLLCVLDLHRTGSAFEVAQLPEAKGDRLLRNCVQERDVVRGDHERVRLRAEEGLEP
jgi:hypothetical protein